MYSRLATENICYYIQSFSMFIKLSRMKTLEKEM